MCIRDSPKRLLFTRKISRYVVQSWNQCNFGLFLPKFGCHDNLPCSPENLVQLGPCNSENHPRIWGPWNMDQLIQAKITQNCTDFSSIQHIKTFFAWIYGWSNSNVLSEFSREQRELPGPWQPNLGQNCTDFRSLKTSRHFSREYMGRRIQMCFQNCQGSKGSCHGNQI